MQRVDNMMPGSGMVTNMTKAITGVHKRAQATTRTRRSPKLCVLRWNSGAVSFAMEYRRLILAWSMVASLVQPCPCHFVVGKSVWYRTSDNLAMYSTCNLQHRRQRPKTCHHTSPKYTTKKRVIITTTIHRRSNRRGCIQRLPSWTREAPVSHRNAHPHTNPRHNFRVRKQLRHSTIQRNDSGFPWKPAASQSNALQPRDSTLPIAGIAI
mmetsp:Transcript_36423/g.53402  ORF Transcript_36423/g.53402 Transcript_36423/m.53402 type:complete len:210 (+) Transcript_36423:168-797(+)